MNDVTIRFPAIAISVGDSFFVVSSLEELTICSTLAWRNGYYENLALFDSAGIYWPLLAHVQRPPNLLDRLLNRKLQVEVAAAEPLADGLSRAVSEICELVDQDPDDLYDSYLSHAELKQRLRRIDSAAALIRLARTLGG